VCTECGTAFGSNVCVRSVAQRLVAMCVCTECGTAFGSNVCVRSVAQRLVAMCVYGVWHSVW